MKLLNTNPRSIRLSLTDANQTIKVMISICKEGSFDLLYHEFVVNKFVVIIAYW